MEDDIVVHKRDKGRARGTDDGVATMAQTRERGELNVTRTSRSKRGAVRSAAIVRHEDWHHRAAVLAHRLQLQAEHETAAGKIRSVLDPDGDDALERARLRRGVHGTRVRAAGSRHPIGGDFLHAACNTALSLINRRAVMSDLDQPEPT